VTSSPLLIVVPTLGSVARDADNSTPKLISTTADKRAGAYGANRGA
jgi:hypothetical protein